MLQIIIGSESNNNFHKYIIIYHGKMWTLVLHDRFKIWC